MWRLSFSNLFVGHSDSLTQGQISNLAFFYGAPGRAHLLGGNESPLLARQGEELAEGKIWGLSEIAWVREGELAA